jgi:uncharacterized protein HemY
MDLGLLHEMRGRLEAAVHELRIARELVPENPGYALTLGALLAKAGLLEAAAVELEAAVERRPSWHRARGYLAHVLRGLGRDDDADRHLRAGLSLEPHPSDPAAFGLRQDAPPPMPVQTLPQD